MNSALLRLSSLFILLAGSALFSGCGGDDTGGDGDGDATGGVPGDGDASGGTLGDGDGTGGGDGDATGGVPGDGDGDGVEHYTPPSSLSDYLADEDELNAMLDFIAENDCDPGMFRLSGVATGTNLGTASSVRTASFSPGPGVETFNAVAAELNVTLSWDSGTANGSTALMAGGMTAGESEFCFEGGVRPRVDFEGNEYMVFTAATLFEVSNGECTTNLLAFDVYENYIEVCVATEPTP